MILITKWVNFKTIMLKERYKTQKRIFFMIPFMWNLGQAKSSVMTEVRKGVGLGWSG